MASLSTIPVCFLNCLPVPKAALPSPTADLCNVVCLCGSTAGSSRSYPGSWDINTLAPRPLCSQPKRKWWQRVISGGPMMPPWPSALDPSFFSCFPSWFTSRISTGLMLQLSCLQRARISPAHHSVSIGAIVTLCDCCTLFLGSVL